jgi:hypothetical protein
MVPLSKLIRAASLFLVMTCAFAAPSLAAPAYELAVVPPVPNGSPFVYRINVASGEVSYVSGNNFLALKDAQPIPPGSYHLHLQMSTDGKGTYWLYRSDAETGRTWFLGAGSWTEIVPK